VIRDHQSSGAPSQTDLRSVGYRGAMAAGRATQNPGSARRKPGQLRQELIEVARASFIEAGFKGASMRQIAARANTTDAMLYRYFDSKAELFEASVLSPFKEFVSGLVSEWQSQPVSSLPNETLLASFTEQVYDFTVEHRRLMLALIAADAFDDDPTGNVRQAFTETIGQIVHQVKAEQEARGLSAVDIEIAAPAMMAMIIATALLEEWLLAHTASGPTRQRILAELTQITSDTAARPQHPGSPPRQPRKRAQKRSAPTK
jgi:AcrR family transcriptional regulator